MKIKDLISESTIGDKFNDTSLSGLDSALNRYILDPMYKFEINPHFDEGLKAYGNDQPLTIHRGLNFDSKEDYLTFKKHHIQGDSLITEDISSWSTDYGEAKNFAITKPSYMDFMTPDKMAHIHDKSQSGEHITGYIGIMLTTVIDANIGIDLSNTGFSKEGEVLLPAGTYPVKIEKIESFANQTKGINVNDYIKNLNKTATTDDWNILNYLLKHNANQLTDSSKQLLWDIINPSVFKYSINSKYDVTLDHIKIKVAHSMDEKFIQYRSLLPASQVESYLQKTNTVLDTFLKDIQAEYSNSIKTDDVTFDGLSTFIIITQLLNRYVEVKRLFYKLSDDKKFRD